MSHTHVSWRVAVLLGTVALVRPLLSITGLSDGWGRPATPLVATLVISVLWVLAGRRTPYPLETLVATGLVYAVLATLLSAILSPILDGELSGPLANPAALVGLVALNVVWGAVCGLIALSWRPGSRSGVPG